LIRFGLFVLRLQIDDLGNTIPSENMMVTSYPFLKFKATKQRAQFSKLDV